MIDERFPEALIDLVRLIEGRAALLSIDTDFFIRENERRLAPALEMRLADLIAAGVPATCRDDHVDLVGMVREPTDVVINFDSHMDLSLGFLGGAAPHMPAQDATVFETLLSSDLVGRYVWAHPIHRRREAALAFAAALRIGRQPLVRRIHCLTGDAAVNLLDFVRIEAIFICRSPGYGVPESEAVYERLRQIALKPSPTTHGQ